MQFSVELQFCVSILQTVTFQSNLLFHFQFIEIELVPFDGSNYLKTLEV